MSPWESIYEWRWSDITNDVRTRDKDNMTVYMSAVPTQTVRDFRHIVCLHFTWQKQMFSMSEVARLLGVHHGFFLTCPLPFLVWTFINPCRRSLMQSHFGLFVAQQARCPPSLLYHVRFNLLAVNDRIHPSVCCALRQKHVVVFSQRRRTVIAIVQCSNRWGLWDPENLSAILTHCAYISGQCRAFFSRSGTPCFQHSLCYIKLCWNLHFWCQSRIRVSPNSS